MIEICAHFPNTALRLPGSGAVSFLGHEPGRYACMAVSVSFLCGACLLPLAGPLAAALSFLGSTAFFSMLPAMEKSRRAGEMETELPLFLRSLGMLLEFGLPLERSLELASEDCGALGTEMKVWTAHMRSGVGARSALSMMALQYESAPLKRAVSSLLICLESGSRGTEIGKMGDDMLAQEQHKIREYSARSAILGLLLIVVCAIMPTFFILYSLSGLGNVGMDQIRLAMLLLFPLLGLLVMILSRAMIPRTLFSPSAPGLSHLAPGALIGAGYAAFPGLGPIFLAGGVACGGYVLWNSLARERRTEELERSIPDALFLAGGMPGSTQPEKLFGIIADGGFGALSEEAEKSRSQLRSRVPLNPVLEDLWRRNGSGMLRRSCMMLGQMVDTGSLNRVGMLADDMMKQLQVRRERAASLAMQKYTLLAGALVIPLIMKMTLGLLRSMGGAPGGIDEVSSLIPPYLLIYSAMGSASIGEYEGKRSAAVIYLALMASSGLLAFHFINF